jgi:HEAT repeat protein
MLWASERATRLISRLRATPRPHVCFALLLVLAALASAPVRLLAGFPDRVLGRTWAEWSQRCDDPSQTVRLQALRTIPHFGPSSAAVLVEKLKDPEPAVRWTAANGLGTLAALSPTAVTALAKAMDDPEPAVRVVAAGVLARTGSSAEALSDLVRLLNHPSEAVRLAAIGAVEELAENARPALDGIHRALEDRNKYVVRIATRIVNALEGTQLKPP